MIVGGILQKMARKRPHKTALIHNNVRVSFPELDILSNRMANWLVSVGLKKGDRGIILLPNCVEYAVAYFALLKIGVIAVVLDVRMSPEEMAPIFAETHAKLLVTHFTHKAFGLRMRREPGNLRCVIAVDAKMDDTGGFVAYERIVEEGDPGYPVVHLHESDEALYLYTSGTTGRPRGVVLAYHHLSYFPQSIKNAVPIDDGDVNACILPMSHISGPVTLNLMAEVGLTVVIVDEIRPKKILQELEKHRVSFFHAVGPIFRMILDLPSRNRYDLSSLRFVVMMGAVVSKRLMEEWVREYAHTRALEGYGATETSPLLTFTPYGDAVRKIGSAGIPVPGVELKIVDREGKELPPGEVGEIIARGPQIMKSYFNDPSSTAQKIRGGWYHTGDLGRLDEEGYLYLLGRADDLVITGGMNVYPSEVEGVLSDHPKVAEVLVAGIPDGKRGQVLKALVVPKPGEKISRRQLLTFCRERLAGYKIPRAIDFYGILPRSRTGKVVKGELEGGVSRKKKLLEFMGRRRKVVGPLILITVWFLLSITGLVDPFFLPSPVKVGGRMILLLGSLSTYEHLLKTFYRMLGGYFLAIGIGVPLGIVLGYWERIYESVEFIIDFFRSFPATAIFPLFMLAFGIGDASKIALVVFACSLLILVNTTYGVHGCCRTRTMVAQTMRASRIYIMTRVVLPEALPQISAGLRLALSLSLIIMVVLEMFIGTRRGLGFLIYNSHMTYQIADMYAYIIMAGIIGYLLNQGYVRLEKKVIHWRGK